MLFLVFADGNDIGVVYKYIGRHQNGIIEKAAIERVFMLCRLVFVLRHSLELSDWANAAQNPSQFGMADYRALQKQVAFFGVETACHILGGAVVNIFFEFGGNVGNRDCVHIHHAEIAFVFFRHFDPIFHRAEIIAQVEFPRRLGAS